MSHAISKHTDTKTPFGFWVYLMTDCILFATLFATYAVLRNNTYGGPGGNELFDMPYVLVETLILLTSSFTCGLGMLAVHKRDKKQLLTWFSITFALGLAFLGMELYEFSHLVNDGHSWQASAFLSAFFTLVGTHGLHITAGLLWMGILLVYVVKRGLAGHTAKRLLLLSLFWHFLDIVWIFIFTFVFLFSGAETPSKNNLHTSSQTFLTRSVPRSIDVPTGISLSSKTVLLQKSSGHNHTNYPWTESNS